MGLSLANPRQRVVITGLGVVAPNGIGKDAFWDAIVQGRSGIDWITSFDTSHLYCKIAGQVTDFEPTDYMSSKRARRAGRFSHFAVAASRLAVEDADLVLPTLDPYACGAVFGTSLAGNGNIADQVYRKFAARDLDDIEITAATQLAAHAATSHVFMELGMKGPNSTSATGCVATHDAVGIACSILRSGQARVMVAGGTEACVSPVGMSLLCKQRVLTRLNDPPHNAPRPYDNTRDGLVLSEGAGAVVLETAEHAMGRGAHIYAEVAGYGSTTEAQHLIAATTNGAELSHAFRAALLSGKVGPEEIDYVCAHGIGNRQYDIAETNAIKEVLGPRAYRIPVSSIKSSTGQSFGAGGAWQLVSSCMTMATGLVPPTINYHVPDPECDLDYVPDSSRRARVNVIMMNSHSFGGTHASLIIRRFDAYL